MSPDFSARRLRRRHPRHPPPQPPLTSPLAAPRRVEIREGCYGFNLWFSTLTLSPLYLAPLAPMATPPMFLPLAAPQPPTGAARGVEKAPELQLQELCVERRQRMQRGPGPCPPLLAHTNPHGPAAQTRVDQWSDDDGPNPRFVRPPNANCGQKLVDSIKCSGPGPSNKTGCEAPSVRTHHPTASTGRGLERSEVPPLGPFIPGSSRPFIPVPLMAPATKASGGEAFGPLQGRQAGFADSYPTPLPHRDPVK